MIDLPFTSPALVFFMLAILLLVAPLAAERVRLPGVIGLVLAGLAVGPEGIGLLSRAGTVEQLGGFGLLYLMLLAALELDPAWLWTDADLNLEALSSVLVPGDVLVMSAPGRRTMITPLALDLVDGFPDVSVIIVSPSTPGLDVGISEIFASN